jgi:hypothetical protein
MAHTGRVSRPDGHIAGDIWDELCRLIPGAAVTGFLIRYA